MQWLNNTSKNRISVYLFLNGMPFEVHSTHLWKTDAVCRLLKFMNVDDMSITSLNECDVEFA